MTGKTAASAWSRLVVASCALATLILFVVVRPFYDVETHAWRIAAIEPVEPTIQTVDHDPQDFSRMLITGGLESEAPAWLSLLPGDMDYTYYPVLNGSAQYVNKGHEAMFYLRYILDHYDALPQYMVFVHDHQRAWHNSDTTDRSILHLLTDLQWPYVEDEGFVNLRCQTKPNCPSILPLHTFITAGKMETFFQDSWMEIFEDEFGPQEQIAATCCAQFAVTRDAVHLRSKAFYARIIAWIEASPGTDWQLGRVLEYTWHIIFGKPSVNCPDTETCRFNLYGYKRELF